MGELLLPSRVAVSEDVGAAEGLATLGLGTGGWGHLEHGVWRCCRMPLAIGLRSTADHGEALARSPRAWRVSEAVEGRTRPPPPPPASAAATAGGRSRAPEALVFIPVPAPRAARSDLAPPSPPPSPSAARWR